tara:strand:- start:1377 stop:2531 length:1155 start_codon:yes stop_codon:yes gene_type:complete
MGPLTQTQRQYYDGKRKSFTGDGIEATFTLANSPDTFPSTFSSRDVKVYLNDVIELASDHDASGTLINNWTIQYNTISGWCIDFLVTPASGVTIDIYADSSFGNYQFTSLNDIISQFMFVYVGEDKLISNAKRTDVTFFAQRALQELSFDTFKSCKSQEIEIPASLTMILPQDYVNYTKLTWSDSAGIEHVIYPARKTSNPSNPLQDVDGNFDFKPWSTGAIRGDDSTELIPSKDSDTWGNYKSATPSENQDDYQDGTYWPTGGERYGLNPEHAQVNGSFYIDCNTGLIHFSSNMNGKTVTLHYLSDGMGTDEEMQVHKLAEEAIYKWIAYGILSSRHSIPEYIINRYKREKFAETRKAKLRLSNIKLEEITQILRGKSKQIKH